MNKKRKRRSLEKKNRDKRTGICRQPQQNNFVFNAQIEPIGHTVDTKEKECKKHNRNNIKNGNHKKGSLSKPKNKINPDQDQTQDQDKDKDHIQNHQHTHRNHNKPNKKKYLSFSYSAYREKRKEQNAQKALDIMKQYKEKKAKARAEIRKGKLIKAGKCFLSVCLISVEIALLCI